MRISVVIPTYNREETITMCLDSVVKQTYHPYEIIVVDDASTDSTVKVIKAYQNELVRVIQCSHNKGAQAARNIGIREAKGDWIAFHDSDDLWLPNKLEMQKEAVEKSGFDVCAGGGIQKKGNEESPICLNGFSGNIYKEVLEQRMYIMYPTLLVKKDILEEIGNLDESVVAYQELDTSIRLAQKNNIIYINKPLFVYVIHDTMFRNSKRGLRGVKYLYKKYYKEIIRQCGIGGLTEWHNRLAHNYGRKNVCYYVQVLLSILCKKLV